MDEDWKSGGTLTRGNALLDGINKSIRNLHGIQGVALCKAGLYGKLIKIYFIKSYNF